MISIGDAPLRVEPLVEAVHREDCGAIVSFLGTVRRTGDGERAVDGMEYEAYAAMALREMRAIAAEAERRFAGARVAIAHRTGKLDVGEPSVAVVAVAPHRAAAFDACEYAIDELKSRVPIWKKEHYRDGGAAWRANQGDAT